MPPSSRPALPAQIATGLSRRRWLAASAAALLIPPHTQAQQSAPKSRASNPKRPQADPPKPPRTTLNDHEAAALAAVRARASQNGINTSLDVDQSENYIGIGNAAPAFRKKALDLCENLAKDFLQHFNFRGFEVKPPDDRLIVVLLADAQAFERYLGNPVPELVRGIYDLGDNRLVCYDQRSREDASPMSLRINTIALMHEGTHQLTYNTGLLDRFADTPHLVAEGLGVYGEVRRPDGKTKIGAPNLDRLDLLRQRSNLWIPLPDLLDNQVFADPDRQQLAYAQAWVFTHYHLSDAERRKRFKSYLAKIRERRPKSQRIADMESTLGDLANLDQSLKRHAARLSPKR